MGRILAVIPARGGSKSVAMKNLAPVGGRPLIAYTIDAALQARQLSRTIVSTDSQAIAEAAQKLGAEVPFLRSAELAQDDTPAMATLLDAVARIEAKHGEVFEHVVYLQPTSPLRTAEDIDAAISLGVLKNADGVVSVTLADRHPYWMKLMDAEGRLIDFAATEQRATRRQDLPRAYCLNGAIYLGRRDVLLGRQTWYTERTYGYVMPAERSLDVDSTWDVHLADLILKDRRKNGND